MAIPIGVYLSAVLAYLAPVAATAAIIGVGSLAASIGGPVGSLITELVVEGALSRAIDFAFGAVEGAVRGKVLTVPVNNGLLGEAERFFLADAPKLAVKLAPMLRAKLFARLSSEGTIPAGATAADHGVDLPVRVK